MDEVTLKPCPFCGSAAKIIAPLGYGNVRACECSNADDCAATGPWSANEAEAIAAWNQRADAQDVAALVEAAYALLTICEMTTFSDHYPSECENLRAVLAEVKP